jgi:K+-transporting ATPase c subunit
MKGSRLILAMAVAAVIAFLLLLACSPGIAGSHKGSDAYATDDGDAAIGRVAGSVRVLGSILLGSEETRTEYFHGNSAAGGKEEDGSRARRAAAVSVFGPDSRISPESADAQVARIARARGMSEDSVRALVDAATERTALAFIGRTRVNVLKLNLSLDKAAAK